VVVELAAVLAEFDTRHFDIHSLLALSEGATPHLHGTTDFR
jgi:hypothetical protein